VGEKFFSESPFSVMPAGKGLFLGSIPGKRSTAQILKFFVSLSFKKGTVLPGLKPPASHKFSSLVRPELFKKKKGFTGLFCVNPHFFEKKWVKKL